MAAREGATTETSRHHRVQVLGVSGMCDLMTRMPSSTLMPCPFLGGFRLPYQQLYAKKGTLAGEVACRRDFKKTLI